MRLSTVLLLGMIGLLQPHAALADGSTEAAEAPFVRGEYCTLPWQQALDPQPLGPGPLTLAAVYCHWGKIGSHYHFRPAVSPDGRKRATFGQDRGVLRMMDLTEKESSVSYDTGAVFDEWAMGTDPVIQWSADSRFLWGARQERMKPAGGWALSPLQPVRIALNGQASDLPPLEHPAGSLDTLLWVGGGGLALAQFGTKGEYYRPKRDNPTPTYAIVDAAAGRVIDDLPVYELDPLLDPNRYPNTKWLSRHVLATQLPDGRVQALFDFSGSWIQWTQGEAARAIPALPAARAYSLSPDGKRVLLTKPEVPAGDVVIGSECGRTNPPSCQPRQRLTMPLLSLRDVATGREIWSLARDFDVRDEFPQAAIGPDNRLALVGLVPPDVAEGEEHSALYSKRRTIALVSLEDGEVLQEVPAPQGTYAMGFAEGGNAVWVQNVNSVTLYRIDRSRPGLR